MTKVVREVVLSDLQKKTARLRVQVKATKPPFIGLGEIFGLGIGQLPRDGVILVLKNGKIIPIPVPFPEPLLHDLRSIIRGHLLSVLSEDPGANVTDFQYIFVSGLDVT